ALGVGREPEEVGDPADDVGFEVDECGGEGGDRRIAVDSGGDEVGQGRGVEAAAGDEGQIARPCGVDGSGGGVGDVLEHPVEIVVGVGVVDDVVKIAGGS